jgi:nucleoside-diphosphate-sugar epimerase
MNSKLSRKRRVLVTGAGGSIGRYTVEYLLEKNFEISALTMNGGYRAPDPARTVVADAADEEAVGAALKGCDAVVHLAALAHPSLGAPREVFANNVVSTFTVLSAAAAHGVRRAVIASSINAFGVPFNPHGPGPAYFPLDEALPVDIADAYSLSKWVDEQSAAMAARTWGMEVVAFRFPLVKEPDELRRTAADVARAPETMMRTGWAYLTVQDAAEAIDAALRTPVHGAHVVGLSAVDTLLPAATAELLDTYAAQVPRRRRFTGREALVDTSRARELLGLSPGRSIYPGGSYPGDSSPSDDAEVTV